MRAKCAKCGSTVEVTKDREYKTCKCGAIGLDYGDGYYYRVCGNPKNFDGKIEGVPKLEDPIKSSEMCNADYDLASIDLSELGKSTISDPDLEALSNYYADIANCFERLADDFNHLSKVMEDRNERYGETRAN